MYQSKLIDAYKQAQNYVQDKQIAMDMDIPPQRISDFRKGKRYMSDSQAIFLAENSGLDPELALLGVHADKNDNPSVKALWMNIAKKYNGLGITMSYAAVATAVYQLSTSIPQFALGILC